MKNPLIPMMAITGNPTKSEINEIVSMYARQGIEQLLIYPRSGCEIEYLSDRWIEVCGDIIEAAKRLKIDIWLYDEYNWPSGTCHGNVMRENEDYYAKSVFVENGKCDVKINTKYADILNADAVDCFIKNTHEVYFRHFGEYFGTVIKGIFTDEPEIWTLTWNGGKYPYTKNLEVIYHDRFGRDLFEDMTEGEPSKEFKLNLMELLSELFITNYLKKINDWCISHGIFLTGHTMNELNMCKAVKASGNTIKALRSFSLPGIDEIFTHVSIAEEEWLTFGSGEAAIREVGNGGLAELFALGPTDIPPSRIEQMIWLSAMFKIDHYVLAVSALDAKGNVEKCDYYNPMCYTSPWFEGYKDLSYSAAEAARYAKKTFSPQVVVRYPVEKTVENLFTEKENLISERICELLRALVKNQYQWQLIDVDEPAIDGAYLVEIDDREDFSVSKIISDIQKSVNRDIYVLEDNEIADEVLVRKYDDGIFLILDLKDSNQTRELTVVYNGENRFCRLCGRGHYSSDDKTLIESVIKSLDDISFKLSLDSNNLLRCVLHEEKSEFVFYAAEDLEKITLAIRNYLFDGEIIFDGNKILPKNKCNQLKKGLNELYLSTDSFTIKKGYHKITLNTPSASEYYLPSCFICGEFAVDKDQHLRKIPETVSCGRLDENILPQYAGSIIYEADVEMPSEKCSIRFDSSELYTQLYINEELLGGQWKDYCFGIPSEYLGKKAKIKIVQYTTIGPIFGNVSEFEEAKKAHRWVHPWLGSYAPGKYQKIGISDMRFIKKNEA